MQVNKSIGYKFDTCNLNSTLILILYCHIFEIPSSCDILVITLLSDFILSVFISDCKVLLLPIRPQVYVVNVYAFSAASQKKTIRRNYGDT